ncbi:MAG: hypothetical protein IKK17_00495, partial [Oscillospiraceae bacterium]|nr:hypothetical protein [Oscillospiraceae bacterium]
DPSVGGFLYLYCRASAAKRQGKQVCGNLAAYNRDNGFLTLFCEKIWDYCIKTPFAPKISEIFGGGFGISFSEMPKMVKLFWENPNNYTKFKLW